jgi:hypothetical protein
MRNTQEKAIEQLFNAGATLEGRVWRLKLSPPGHHHHQPEDIEQIAKAVAQVQSGLSTLRRVLKREKRLAAKSH